LIYFAVIALTRRNSAWGYGAGCIISVFWNYINLFVTTFIKAGVEQLLELRQTGRLKRPDLALSLIAAGGNFLLIIACYFVATIITTGPQYIDLLRRVFGL
jgi:hypothetical protein